MGAAGKSTIGLVRWWEARPDNPTPRVSARLKAESRQKPKRASVIESVVDLSEIRTGKFSAGIGELRRIGEVDRLRRNVMRQSAPRLQSLERPALKLEIFPLRKVARPRLPHISAGALMKRKTERGSNWVEVSGLPIVRPSTDGSTTIGRSRLFPSTLPIPGASAPDITVNGVPVFNSVMADNRTPGCSPTETPVRLDLFLPFSELQFRNLLEMAAIPRQQSPIV